MSYAPLYIQIPVYIILLIKLFIFIAVAPIQAIFIIVIALPKANRIGRDDTALAFANIPVG